MISTVQHVSHCGAAPAAPDCGYRLPKLQVTHTPEAAPLALALIGGHIVDDGNDRSSAIGAQRLRRMLWIVV